MRSRVLPAVAFIALVSPASADIGVGHPFPALASECTPAIPGVACPADDPLGVGRVEMSSGEYFLEERDLRIAGRGFDFDMRRTYRSRGERNRTSDTFMQWQPPFSDFGEGWDFTYNIWLESYIGDIPYGCHMAGGVPDDDIPPAQTYVPASFVRVHMGNGRTQSFGRSMELPYNDLNSNGHFDAEDECLNPDPTTGELVLGDFSGDATWMTLVEDPPDDRTSPTTLGGFTLEFGDGSRWHFKTYYRVPLRYCSGCIEEFPPESLYWQDSFRAACDWIEDVNGNRMHLLYDWPEYTSGWGTSLEWPRLRSVIDTLGREIEFLSETVLIIPGDPESAYERLVGVRDWTGRTVTYSYDDSTGGTRKLQSVTSPAVTGTPKLDDATSSMANDFPAGKTRTYEYAWGTGVPWPTLGNIRSIEDAAGQTLVELEYSTGTAAFDVITDEFVSCTDEADELQRRNETDDFNRVTRHVVGGQSTWFDYVRMDDVPLSPSCNSCSDRAMLRCTVTDPAGNVSVSEFNRFNLVARKRDYVGRANPSAPATTSVGANGEVIFVSNPPVSPLRGTDLSSQPGLQEENDAYFYETLHEYNANGLPRRNYPPNSTAASSSLYNVPSVSYAYLPRTAPWSASSWCDVDVTQMPRGIISATGLTRGMPRHVLRDSGTAFESGEEQCLATHSQYEADDPYSDTIDLEGRAVVKGTRHLSEPDKLFEHDDHGNLLTTSMVDGWTVTELESYQYEDITVTDSLVPGGTRTVRRLSGVFHPPHVVDGVPYSQHDRYFYYGSDDCPDPGDTTNALCPMVGFLKSIVEDADPGGIARTTIVEYDALGRVVLQHDPAGNEIVTTWNALDQVLRQETHWTRADATAGVPMRTDTHFDIGNRPVRTDVRRLGLTGVDQFDDRATTITRYDEIGRPIALMVELEHVSESLLHDLEHDVDWESILATSSERELIALTKTAYGLDGQVARIDHPEATVGRQPGNAETRLYDERGLLYRTTLAPGEPEEVTSQQDYDGNGNVVRVTVGVGTSDPHVTTKVYDGFDRLRVTIDAMGNEHHRSYAHGTLVDREWVMGQVLEDLDGNGDARCLSATKIVYDDQRRPIEQGVALFDEAPLTCAGLFSSYPSGWAVTSQELSLRGAVLSSTDARGKVTTYELDGLGRTIKTVDPAGDWTAVTLNANSVPVVTESWQQADLGLSALGFSTSVTTDSLGRIVESYDVAGHVTLTDYAEGQRVLRTTDALGFEVRFDHDTAGRLRATRRDLWENGTYVREVITRQSFDHDSRLIVQEDDPGNETNTFYDSRGQAVKTMLADGSVYESGFDVFGNLVWSLDPKGNEIESTYDRLGRRTGRDSVVEGTGTSPATGPDAFAYDGLGRMTAHGPVATSGRHVTLTYDSRGNVLTESASDGGVATFSTRHVYDERGSRLASCYEASGSQVRYERDDVGRLRSVLLRDDWTTAMICGDDDPGELHVVDHDFIGPRILRRTYGNGVVMDFERDEDLHRKVDTVTRPASGGGVETLYTRTYLRDVVHQRDFLGKSELHEVSLVENHDSLRRLIESDHGGDLVEFHLDGAGNRTFVRDPMVTSYYTMAVNPETHRYDSAGDFTLGYDLNGNVVARVPVTGHPQPPVRFWFDAYNRPGQALVGDTEPWDIVTDFGYDALNRRVSKASEGTVSTSAAYFHDGEQLVEERDGVTGDVTFRVYGGWALDDLVLQIRDGERTWVTTDAQASVLKAFDDDAELIEQFSYDDFGRPARATEIDGTFSTATESAAGLSQLFTGAWYDWELNLYWMRTRYMDPDLGRFLSRDSAGIWADAAALGNGYTYAANNPGTFVDPLGLFAMPHFDAGSNDGGDCLGGPRLATPWLPERECFLCADAASGDAGEPGRTGETSQGVTTDDAAGVADFIDRKLDEGVKAVDAMVLDGTVGTRIQDAAEVFRFVANGFSDLARAGSETGELIGQDTGNNVDWYDYVTAAGHDIGRAAGIFDILGGLGVRATAGRTAATTAVSSEGAVLSDAEAAAISGGCFASGTLVATSSGGRPIDTIAVGQRVLADDGSSSPTSDSPLHRLEVEFRTTTGQIYQLVLLRDQNQLEAFGCSGECHGGETSALSLTDLGLTGHGRVLNASQVMTVTPSHGRIVTGTSRTTVDNTRALQFVDGSSVLITDGHLVFSETRNGWVQAKTVSDGESLRTPRGTIRVAANKPRPGALEVFNLEVEGRHCYFAGSAGILSHNDSASAVATRRLGDLEPIHKPGMNPATETRLRSLSDRELLETVTSPLDGQSVKVKPGSNRVLDGNTRVMEMQRRLDPDTRIPVDEDL